MRACWCFVAAAILAGCQWDWDRFDPNDAGADAVVAADAPSVGGGDAATPACGAAGGACCASGDPCAAGLSCLQGACGSCGGGLTLCANACVDADSDPANCGGCGISCGAAACRHARCL